MTDRLAHVIAQADIQRLALVGLAKNVGKTTTTNHLLNTFLQERLYAPQELALTSLGLDGESTDALTGLPKPRYVPQTGILVATAANLLMQAERDGASLERLVQLPGRSALGSIWLARMLHPGGVVVAGPTLLRDLRSTLDIFHQYGATLSMIDGAINRVGAGAPSVTDACIACTGASVAATPDLVARRTGDVLERLLTPQTQWADAYRTVSPQARLLAFFPDQGQNMAQVCQDHAEPPLEAAWMTRQLATGSQAFFLRGALTAELAQALLAQRAIQIPKQEVELIVHDATRLFCHTATLQRLAARGLHVRVAQMARVLAITVNPYTPAYVCSSAQLFDVLTKVLPAQHPPLFDVVSGLYRSTHM